MRRGCHDPGVALQAGRRSAVALAWYWMSELPRLNRDSSRPELTKGIQIFRSISSYGDRTTTCLRWRANEAASGHLSGSVPIGGVDRGRSNRHLLRSADLGVGGKAQPVDTAVPAGSPRQIFPIGPNNALSVCRPETHHA